MQTSTASSLEYADEQDLCIECSFAKAKQCRWASINKVAEMGADNIYQCEPCGISFCLRTNDDNNSYTEVIACAEFD